MRAPDGTTRDRPTIFRAWRSVRAIVALAALTACGIADAAYRCEQAGRVAYSDQPCPSGLQTEISTRTASPSVEDSRAADDRQKADAARLAAIEHNRDLERRQDQHAAAAAARRDAGIGKQANACRKLASRAQRAHGDYDTAGPREQRARQSRMRRADDDFAALCARR